METLIHVEPVRFDENTNPNWQTQEGWNALYLRSVLHSLNDRLQVKGYLFLNDVYDQLEFKRIPEGQRVGWLVGEDVFHWAVSDHKDHFMIGFYGYHEIWDKI